MPDCLVDDRAIGTMTNKLCPKCRGAKLFSNDNGSEWCSDIECSYYIRDGVEVVVGTTEETVSLITVDSIMKGFMMKKNH